MKAAIPLLLFLAACGGSGDATPDATIDAPAAMDAVVAHDAPTADAPAVDAPIDAPVADMLACHTDADGDGHVALACGGDDCNDGDPNAYPGHPEVCDAGGHDEDCNPATLGPDGDGDGFPSTACCDFQPSGTLLCGGDCDDTRATVSPSAVESCNGVDDDCNGIIDDGLLMDYYPDCDADGHGDAAATPMHGCSEPVGAPSCGGVLGAVWATTHDDCVDTAAGIHPGATEVCDAVDDDCDPSTIGSADRDADGVVSAGCCNPQPSGPPLCGTDCDDGDATVHPGATEVCDGLDQNCNRMRDEGLTGCTPASRAHVMPCPTTCNLTSSVCCIGSGTPPALSCTSASCPIGTVLSVRCDGPEDCGGANICCVTFSGVTMGASCASVASCAFAGAKACHDMVDCPVGQRCEHRSLAGVSYGACRS